MDSINFHKAPGLGSGLDSLMDAAATLAAANPVAAMALAAAAAMALAAPLARVL